MGRFANAGFGIDAMDNDVVAAEAWSAAFDNADISDDLDDGFDAVDGDQDVSDDDLLSLIAQRPSRRARAYPRA